MMITYLYVVLSTLIFECMYMCSLLCCYTVVLLYMYIFLPYVIIGVNAFFY